MLKLTLASALVLLLLLKQGEAYPLNARQQCENAIHKCLKTVFKPTCGNSFFQCLSDANALTDMDVQMASSSHNNNERWSDFRQGVENDSYGINSPWPSSNEHHALVQRNFLRHHQLVSSGIRNPDHSSPFGIQGQIPSPASAYNKINPRISKPSSLFQNRQMSLGNTAQEVSDLNGPHHSLPTIAFDASPFAGTNPRKNNHYGSSNVGSNFMVPGAIREVESNPLGYFEDQLVASSKKHKAFQRRNNPYGSSKKFENDDMSLNVMTMGQNNHGSIRLE
jgi:hypothetical protein